VQRSIETKNVFRQSDSPVAGAGGCARWQVDPFIDLYIRTRWGRLGGDSGGAVKLGPGLSFSWKRALLFCLATN
jgi:hypothetical protein